MHIEELILRVARGEAGAGETAIVDAWRSDSFENQGRFSEILCLAQLAMRADALESPPVPTGEIVRQARARQEKIGAPHRRPGP